MRTFLNLVIEKSKRLSLKIDTESRCLYQLIDMYKGSVASIFHQKTKNLYFPKEFNMFSCFKIKIK